MRVFSLSGADIMASCEGDVGEVFWMLLDRLCADRGGLCAPGLIIRNEAYGPIDLD